jgi:hypothetical protein
MTAPAVTGVRRRNPFAAVAALLTSLVCGLLFAAIASYVAYAVGRPPPDEAEARQILGDVLPGVTLTVWHVGTEAFDRDTADFHQYQLGHTDAQWSDSPANGLAAVADQLSRTGWTVTGPTFASQVPARVIVAHGYDTEVIAFQPQGTRFGLRDDLRVVLRRDPPEATGAAAVFGVGGAVLVWWTIARLRRRMDFSRHSAPIAVLMQIAALVILVPIVLFHAVTVGFFTSVNLMTVATVVRPSLWHHLGLPGAATWWLIGMALMLTGFTLALWSTRRTAPRGTVARLISALTERVNPTRP